MRDEDILPFVRRIAQVFIRRSPLEFDDLVGEGCIALLQARQRFRTNGGASFSTYAGRRVRGAMIDAIRRHAPLSKVGLREVRDGTRMPVYFVPEDSAYDVPYQETHPDTTIHARELLRVLPPRQRYVIRSYYWNEHNHRAIGQVLGVGETRVSQIRTAVIAALKQVA